MGADRAGDAGVTVVQDSYHAVATALNELAAVKGISRSTAVETATALSLEGVISADLFEAIYHIAAVRELVLEIGQPPRATDLREYVRACRESAEWLRRTRDKVAAGNAAVAGAGR